MTNISLDSLPAKTGTVSDAGIVHYRESGVDKKLTISDLIAKFLANNPKLSSIEALSSIANLLSLAVLNGSANKLPYFNGVGSMALTDLQPNRNAIINGDFNVWQRGTSFTSVAEGTYLADRWFYSKISSAVHNITLSSDVPTVAQAGRLFKNSLKVDCQTVDSSIASGDLVRVSQRIEGFNWLPLAQRVITLSFWVKATKTGTYCVSLGNSGGDRSYVAEYTVNTSNTWEYKTITFTASPSAGTWNYENGIGLALTFTLASGTTFQTTKDTWQTGSFFATSNQVNACDSTSNDFYLAGVQLETGSVATPFEYRSIQQEMSLCQRYLRQAGAGFNGFEETADLFSLSIKFDTPMRASPTLSLMTTSISARYCGPSGVGDVLKTGCSIQAATTTSSYSAWVYIQHTGGGGAVSRQLQSRDSANFIYANAEL